MRITGAALLILGLLLSFSVEDWEAVGLIPTGIGLILLTIAENQASALGSTEVETFDQQMKKRVAPPSQTQLPTADPMLLSPEVLQLLERLSRSSSQRRGRELRRP
jgi:hypothetical protein